MLHDENLGWVSDEFQDGCDSGHGYDFTLKAQAPKSSRSYRSFL